MVQSQERFPTNVDWQLTTTTIWCPEVERRVTLIVKSDWTSYCCWHQERQEQDSQVGVNRCKGSQCDHVGEYKDKLVQEEMKG